MVVLDLFTYFIRRNNTDGVLNYIINGADVEEALSNGLLPIEWALRCQAEAVYEMLIDFGANPTEPWASTRLDT